MTEGRLPQAWRLRNFGGWRGTAPTRPHDLTSSEPVAPDNAVDKSIRLRNSVAHQTLAQNAYEGPLYWSDAQSHTIQAGWARLVLALFLQLTQQTMKAVATAAGYSASTEHRLPASWFAGETPRRLRGVDNPGRRGEATASTSGQVVADREEPREQSHDDPRATRHPQCPADHWKATGATRGRPMTIALFPDGTRVAVYDDGMVKVGRDDYRVKVDRTHNYGRGSSDHGSGFVKLEFEPLE